MPETIVDLVRQSPHLAALIYIVWKFLGHSRDSEADCRQQVARISEALDRNSQALAENSVLLKLVERRLNGRYEVD